MLYYHDLVAGSRNCTVTAIDTLGLNRWVSLRIIQAISIRVFCQLTTSIIGKYYFFTRCNCFIYIVVIAIIITTRDFTTRAICRGSVLTNRFQHTYRARGTITTVTINIIYRFYRWRYFGGQFLYAILSSDAGMARSAATAARAHGGG